MINSIQRFSEYWHDHENMEMVPDPEGEWVKFTDLAALALAGKRLADAASLIDEWRKKSLRTADYHGEDCRCHRCAEDMLIAALTAFRKAEEQTQ